MRGSTALALCGIPLIVLMLWSARGVVTPVSSETQLHAFGRIALDERIDGVRANACWDATTAAAFSNAQADYCSSDVPGSLTSQVPASLVPPAEVRVSSSERSSGVVKCACLGTLPDPKAITWTVKPTRTRFGDGTFVYQLRANKVERIDVTLPESAYNAFLDAASKQHGQPPLELRGPNGATLQWTRDYSTLQLTRNPGSIHVALIGGDAHYAASGKSKSVLDRLAEWVEH
jgi:hypothetical protein